MTILLGPCPCQGCGALVLWAAYGARRKAARGGWVARWRNANRRVHRCKRDYLGRIKP